MSYEGDIRLGDTIDLKFTTRSFTTGAPTTLAGTPVISAYPGNSTTQLTAGITLTVDFDGVTGLHNIRVVATSGNGYATATNYSLVITTGTVGGVSVVGEVVGSFSIENRSALMPTTAARTLDVTAANKVNGVVLVDTLTTYTGNTVQTGDSFARLGAPAGASISADIAAIDAAGLVVPAGYVGDFRLGSQFSFKFLTVNPTTGVPTALLGTPEISVFIGDNTTQLTAGVTLIVDFDGRAGLNHVTILPSGGNGYTAPDNYTAVITIGTVAGISAVNQVIGSFSLEARSALMPTTAARTLVVDAAGLADANVVKLGPTGAGTAQTARDVGATLGVAGAGLTALGDVRIANLDAAMSTRATPTQVNAEVVDALNVDTYAEPAQGAPAATASLVTKLGFLFKAWRNRQTQTSTTYSLYNDDALTVDHKSTVSDDSTTFNRTEIASGP